MSRAAILSFSEGGAETARRDVPGPWHVRFESPAGHEPPPQDFATLSDWSKSADRAVRHFSGSAFYMKELDVAPLAPGERLILDLGDVRDFATVTANGRTCPALWKPPFRVDVTDAVGASRKLSLSIRITNRWPNRLIGDDALPESERGTWTSYRHWTKDEKPLPSGLLGPVNLVTER